MRWTPTARLTRTTVKYALVWCGPETELVLWPGWADVLPNDSPSISNALEEMSAGGVSVIVLGVVESQAARTRASAQTATRLREKDLEANMMVGGVLGELRMPA